MTCPEVLLSPSQTLECCPHHPERQHSQLQCRKTAFVPIPCRRKLSIVVVSSETCQAFVTSCGSPPTSPLVLVTDQMSVLRGGSCLGKLVLSYIAEGRPVAMATETVLATVWLGRSYCVHWRAGMWLSGSCFPSMCKSHVQAPGILSLKRGAYGLRERGQEWKARGRSATACSGPAVSSAGAASPRTCEERLLLSSP